MFQVRERDLSARDATALVARVVEATQGRTLVFVNDRFDVALAAGAAGVHLTTTSLTIRAVRECVGLRLAIGVSTHSLAEVVDAYGGGADFAVCGPVFDTPSKRGMGAPLGLERFADATRATPLPVLALGGIDLESAPAAIAAGAAGIAGIRLFQEAWRDGGFEALDAVVQSARDLGALTTGNGPRTTI
jgi:thiamine-phosphate pyrophosphorylase